MHLGKTGTNRSHCGEYAFRTYRGNGVGTFCSTLFVGSRATGTCANPENGDFGSRPLEAVPLSSVNDTGSVSRARYIRITVFVSLQQGIFKRSPASVRLRLIFYI